MSPSAKDPATATDQFYGLSASEARVLLLGVYLRNDDGKVCAIYTLYFSTSIIAETS